MITDRNLTPGRMFYARNKKGLYVALVTPDGTIAVAPGIGNTGSTHLSKAGTLINGYQTNGWRFFNDYTEPFGEAESLFATLMEEAPAPKSEAVAPVEEAPAAPKAKAPAPKPKAAAPKPKAKKATAKPKGQEA